MIEPSVTYGNMYLDLTREYAAQFKSAPPPSAEEKIALAATSTPRPTRVPTQTPTARATQIPTRTPTLKPTRGPSPTPSPTPISFAAYRTTTNLRVRAGPASNAETLGNLSRDFVLDILGRSADNKWLAIAYPDFGSLGWVSAEFVTPQKGFEQFPIEPAPNIKPTPTAIPAQDSDALPIWY